MGEDGVIWGDHDIDGQIRRFSWPRGTDYSEPKTKDVMMITMISKWCVSIIYERDCTSRYALCILPSVSQCSLMYVNWLYSCEIPSQCLSYPCLKSVIRSSHCNNYKHQQLATSVDASNCKCWKSVDIAVCGLLDLGLSKRYCWGLGVFCVVILCRCVSSDGRFDRI
jgi:hypothetical protein